MLSEEFDKKIRLAAENATQNYDSEPWQRMNSLLDEHLPQKKKRRIFIFFILLGILLATAGILLINRSSSADKSLSQQKNISVSASAEKTKEETSPSEKLPVTDIEISGDKHSSGNKINTEIPAPVTGEKKVSGTTSAFLKEEHNNNKKVSPAGSGIEETNSASFTIRNAGIAKKRKTTSPANKTTLQPGGTTKEEETKKEDNTVAQATGNPTEKKATATTVISHNDKKEQADRINPDIDSLPASPIPSIAKADIVNPDTDTVATETTTQPSTQSSNKPGRKRSSRFSISLSFGPDISSVGIDKPGKWQTAYGIGIGYDISDRFTVRSGFYAARKIYSADSTDYHSNHTGSNPYYKLENVDANCYVYEIPLTFVYSFAKSKKHSWFISAGISSYIMKKETYDYTYKTLSGSPMLYQHVYKNENRHLFSVLGLSGGYQYNISKRFSLMAEPYIRAPFKGVGSGKVKLNSAGILFSAAFKPFK